MGSEQDRGWAIKTEWRFAGLRGGATSFYESRAVHPIYGETTPARSIDEDAAYQETLARIGRMESQIGPIMSMTPMMPMTETSGEAEVETETADTTPNAEMDTTNVTNTAETTNAATAELAPTHAPSSTMPDGMRINVYSATPSPASGEKRGDEPVVDPLAAEYGHNLKPLNFTRRVKDWLANHRRIPKRRPKGRIILK